MKVKWIMVKLLSWSKGKIEKCPVSHPSPPACQGRWLPLPAQLMPDNKDMMWKMAEPFILLGV